MANDLLSLDEAQAYLGSGAGVDNDLIQALLDAAFDQLLSDTHRQGRPFQNAQAGRTEVHRGTAGPIVLLDYPIGSLTTVTLGLDPLEPEETLAVDNVAVMVWESGRRELVRTDGRGWGCYAWPRYVHVTYDAQAFLPAIGKAALMRAVAQLYRNRGSEGSKREKEGSAEREIIQPFTGSSIAADSKDAVWMRAVTSLAEPFTQ